MNDGAGCVHLCACCHNHPRIKAMQPPICTVANSTQVFTAPKNIKEQIRAENLHDVTCG